MLNYQTVLMPTAGALLERTTTTTMKVSEVTKKTTELTMITMTTFGMDIGRCNPQQRQQIAKWFVPINRSAPEYL